MVRTRSAEAADCLQGSTDQRKGHGGGTPNGMTFDQSPGRQPGDRRNLSRRQGATSTGFTFQISLAYSAIVRSELNLPVLAMFKIDFRVQAS